MLNPDEIVLALRKCNSVAECARELGVTRNTIYRYKKDPIIKELLLTIATSSLAQASAEMAVKHNEYVAEMESIATNENVAPAVRVDALKALFAVSKDCLQMHMVDQRLTDIEKQLGAL